MKGFVLNLEEGDLNIIDIYMKCDVLLSNRELVDRHKHLRVSTDGANIKVVYKLD